MINVIIWHFSISLPKLEYLIAKMPVSQTNIRLRVLVYGTFIIASFFLVMSSLKGDAGNYDFESNIYKPAEDLSFIKRFICISDLLGEEQWSKQNGRSFDTDGVALTQGKKHPVNICHYALFCYDEFKATGNTRFKDAFITNAKVLIDSTFYHRTDVDAIAYPYYIKFHDLKPPWYSALAQSEAISVLIRYYELTRDTAVLKTIIELKNFMVAPQQDNCGTMNITPEGHEWYEEYPNSNQERQVLNGFFLAIVALHEYSNLFPNDTATRRLYLNSIETAKQSFKFYDTGSWLRYNRGDKRQTLELKFLYQLTGDEAFKHFMMLVATYCYNKSYVTPGSKLQDYDFSVPMSEHEKGKFGFEGKRMSIDLKQEVPAVTVNCNGLKPNEIIRVYDNNVNSFVYLCKGDSSGKGTFDIAMNFKSKKSINSIQIHYLGLDSKEKPNAEIYYRDTLGGVKQFKLLKPVNMLTQPRSNDYYFESFQATGIQIKINKEGFDGKKMIMLSEIALSTPPVKVESDFMHYVSEGLKGNGEKMTFSFKDKNMNETVIFYRTAESVNNLSRALFKYSEIVSSQSIEINTKENLFYQFMVVCTPKKDEAYLSDISFVSN